MLNEDVSLLDDFLEQLAAGLDPSNISQSVLWKPNDNSPQVTAYHSMADELFYGGAAGGGKAVPDDNVIYTPKGPIYMRNIQVGDAVCTADGGVTSVTAIHPQGKQTVYKLTFDDGATTRATADHLWSVAKSSTDNFQLLTTAQLIQHCEHAPLPPYIPVAQPVLFTDLAKLPIRPYTIGQMLGGQKVDMTNVYNIVGERLMQAGLDRRRRLALAQDVHEPHIPDIYLYASAEQRYDLMAGILDQRGTLTRDNLIVITVSHKSLALDIQWLARSLGAKATLAEGTQACAVKIDTAYNRAYFRFHRLIETQPLHAIRPFTGRYVLNIERESVEEVRCITLEDEKGLFITDDFVVTHNCLTADHDVMTKNRGWQPITQVRNNEEVLGWWKGRFDWKPVLDQIHERHEGDIITYHSPTVQFQATPDHKIPVYINNDMVNDNRPSFVLAKDIKDDMLFVTLGGVVPVEQRYLDFKRFDGYVHCLAVKDWHTFVVRHRGHIHVTGNTDLLLGLALTAGRNSIIYRREYKQFKHILKRARDILNPTGATWNGQDHIWSNIPGGRSLEFGAVKTLDDVTKFQGRPHDHILFDELANFLKDQYLFLVGWNRTDIQGQRVRIVAAGNPPTSADGEWVIQRWAPWIDPAHPNPARPGELRWFARIDDEDQEVEDNKPITWRDEIIQPKSRTFIPARVSDNPHNNESYVATLQSLPEPLRSKMLYGDFGIVFKDDPFQVIPTTFVREARTRWDTMKKEGELQLLENVNVAYGLDPAEGGKDYTALCKITGNAVQFIRYVKLPDTMEVVRWVMSVVSLKNIPIGIDSIGIGAGIFHRLRQLNYQAVGIKVSTHTTLRDRTGQMQFYNLRSALWWLCRDALDPDGTIKLALPPEEKLLRELTAPRWQQTALGLVQVESQDALRERLSRSPDAANSLMMALFVSHIRRPPLRIV